MPARIRWVKPYQVYESSIRTVDRTFLLKPNHHPNNPLLADTCPLNALAPSNDLVPVPSIFNIIGASVGRALEKYPIQIHCFEANISHIHEAFSVTEEQVDNVSRFFQTAHSLIARGVNKTWHREGRVFGGRARTHECVDDAAAEKMLLYAVTNPVKDNLLDTMSKSPLFSTWGHLASGAPLKFWYIDWEAYLTAGGERKKTHRLKDYLKWVSWECTPLPSQQGWVYHQRQTWMRKQVRDIESALKVKREDKGKTVIGKAGLYAVDPRDKPKNPKKSGRRPLCHASDPELAKAYKRTWRQFLNQYIPASADYRNGHFDREFPSGSYRPPLVTIYHASGT
jgi:hypothetical protein